MQTATDHDPIDALKQGKLLIHCFRMELVQNTSTKQPTYAGAGYLMQDESGGLAFTIYANELYNAAAFDFLRSIFDGQAGTIFRDDEYYTLTAYSYWGHTWKAERIITPSVHWHASVPRISGNAHILMRTRYQAVDDSTYNMTLHFFEKVEIPCPILTEQFRGARFTAFADKSFSIHTVGDVLAVEISSLSAFPPHFEIRVVEALQYVFARTMQWRALTTTDKGSEILKLSTPLGHSKQTRLGRPLLATQYSELAMFWRLFVRYLEYVTEHDNGRYFHRCSSYLHNACEASANSPDAWAISLCVSVEKLSGLVGYGEPKDEQAQKIEVQRLVRRWLKAKGWESNTVGQRAAGLLMSMKYPRMKDRLRELIQQGKINQEHLKIWGRMRNPGVHASDEAAGMFTGGGSQKWFNDIGAVTVLMYHLTFHLIGYAESYTDYTKQNWPSAQYPQSLPTERPTPVG